MSEPEPIRFDHDEPVFRYRAAYIKGKWRLIVEYPPRPAWYTRLWRWVMRKEPPHA